MSKKNPSHIKILAAVTAAAAVVMIAALCLTGNTTAPFVPPDFDAAATDGTPQVPENLGYCVFDQEGMSYAFGICGNVTLDENAAIVYLTNPAENTVYLKVRILDEQGNILGQSGLIRPGQYISSVTLTDVPDVGTKIMLKIMSYEPETYMSAGSAVINTQIALP